MMTPGEFWSLFTPLYHPFTNLAELSGEYRPIYMAHYTSLYALEKIIERNEIWFSNPLFMNDQEEMRFGISEVRRILELASAGSPLSDLAGGIDNFNRILQLYNEFIKRFDENVAFDTYVFCLSEYNPQDQPDGRLSMWRGYGANGNGVALVFNTGFVTPVEGSPLLIGKVRYADAKQRADLIENSFRECLELLSKHPISGQTMWVTAWNMFRMALYHALLSKHPGFKEEEEWRIIYLKDLDKNELMKDRFGYFIRGTTVEPKLKFPIQPLQLEPRQEWTFDGILERIVLGPTHATPLAVASAKRMMESLGRREFVKKIWVSQIPYRHIE
jgi:hypothetical protein